MSDELTITKVICQEPTIIKKFENKYPTIKKLFDEKPEQTLSMLKALGALYTKVFRKTLKVNHESNEDNVKAWDDYLPAVESYLASLCKEMKVTDPVDKTEYNLYEHLRPARKAIAEEIHKQHFNKFSYWPEEGQTQESDVELRINGAYKSGNNFYIIWSCYGWIKVKDSVSYDTYNANFEGKPDIKFVMFNYEKLQSLEITAQRDFQKALKSLGKAKELEWDVDV